MPTSYTSLIGLALPVTGELSGTWGDVVNNYITNYLDSAVAGTQTISGSQTAVTLSVTNGSSLVTAGSGATGSAQFQIINCTGNPAGLLTITAPASSRQYIIINATSTSQSVKIVGTGPTTGVTLISGEKAHVAWNGSDFVKIATTAAAGGSNTQVQYNSSGVLAGSSNLTFDGTNLTVGGTASATKLIPTGGAATGNGMYLPAANTLAWSNNGSETMRLDSSGNLGLGVTPSAWASGFRALELPLGTGLWADGGTPSAWLTSNLYFDGSFRYKTSTQATGYNLSGGFHRWYNAPSGTAGNAITFTQAMTLDSSGNLGIGTASPEANGRLTVDRSLSNYIMIRVGGTNKLSMYADSGASVIDSQSNFLGFNNNSVERARITTGGNFGVGTTSPQYRISLGNTTGRKLAVYDDGSSGGTASGFGVDLSGSAYELSSWVGSPGGGNGVFTWGQVNTTTNAYTERVRITSGGSFLVGTTSSSLSGATRSLALVSGSFAAAFQTTSSTATDEVLCLQQSATTGDNTFIIFKTEGGTGTGRGSITYNRGGGVVAYNTTSDYRAKDIIGPVQDTGATVDALKVYMGKMKGATQERPMMIAHEAQEVVPYAVGGEKDAVNEDGTPKYQTMDHQILVPLLLAEIQSLRARVAQLESKGA